MQPYNQNTRQILDQYQVNTKQGLDTERVALLQKTHGFNVLKEAAKTSIFELILLQFQDKLVIILLFAALVSFVLAFIEADDFKAFVEPFVILVILLVNATVGVVQESNAEHAIDALKQYSPDEAKVLRNSYLAKVDSKLLVPGDIVALSVGDKVPADCRLLSIDSSSFKVDQSILTGESVSVPKDPDFVSLDPRAVKQDQINMVFSGTTVTIGRATAIVVKIGEQTAIGEIHLDISAIQDEKTPLKIALDDFGDQLARIISAICILVWLVNINHFDDPIFEGNILKGAVYYFKIAVALAVAAIPEGLSVVITTCLALGTKKMANRGAIVRKLRSVETLGCTTVICSDKTGTLTTNQMCVRKVMWIDKSPIELDVDGTSYGPEGRVRNNKVLVDGIVGLNILNELTHICVLCNDAQLTYDESKDVFGKIGEPTEAALLSFVEKVGTADSDFNETVDGYLDSNALSKLSKTQKQERCGLVCNHVNSLYNKKSTFEFSRDRKSMSVIVEKTSSSPGKTRSKTSSKFLFVKGAPESILERCSFIRLENGDKSELTAKLRDSILSRVDSWAKSSLRVLAFASVELATVPTKVDPTEYIKYESKMTFVGLIGMLDPPRPEVFDSIKKCKDAGVRVIVITGDNKNTAESICRQIGVFNETQDLTGKSFTGREFDDMNLKQKTEAILNADLFSRTEPTHKSQLVDLLKQQGWVVAMTGDGVNDAPALKKADIGIAMGSGTDVAKLASDMVLADDNFATIVCAVEEGRSIYANTKQFIRYLISSNIGEVVSIFLTVVLGMPEALIPVQLLWVNLVTDGLPATALGFNPADHDIMRKPPRDSKEPIVTSWLFFRYMVVGTFVGCATIAGYAWWFMFYELGPQITWFQLSHFHQCSSLFPEIGCEMFKNEMSQKATTMSLSILVVVEMFNAINSLSENESLLTFPLWNNMYLVFSIALSMLLHFMILYVPFFTVLFSITPLNFEEWKWVLIISAPVILIDELLKFWSRNFVATRSASAFKKIGKSDNGKNSKKMA